jgi:hypothetical protein
VQRVHQEHPDSLVYLVSQEYLVSLVDLDSLVPRVRLEHLVFLVSLAQQDRKVF